MHGQFYFITYNYFYENTGELSEEEIAKHIYEELDYGITDYDTSIDHPSKLLLKYDGWYGFAEIAESLFNELYKLDKRKAIN